MCAMFALVFLALQVVLRAANKSAATIAFKEQGEPCSDLMNDFPIHDGDRGADFL